MLDCRKDGSNSRSVGLSSGFVVSQEVLEFNQAIPLRYFASKDLIPKPIDFLFKGRYIQLNPGAQILEGLDLFAGEPEFRLEVKGKGHILTQFRSKAVES